MRMHAPCRDAFPPVMGYLLSMYGPQIEATFLFRDLEARSDIPSPQCIMYRRDRDDNVTAPFFVTFVPLARPTVVVDTGRRILIVS